MKRISVTSSNVSEVGYDQDEELLEVLFSNGSMYHYHAVPFEMYERMMDAESVGSFLAREIKPAFTCERCEETDGDE